MTKAEKIILIITIIFVVFVAGYKIGTNRGSNEMKINAAQSVPAASAKPEKTRLDVNSAGLEELTSLPGVGELIAGEIIAYREAHGDFASVEEVRNVPGMNKELFAMIEDLICVK